MSSAATEKKWLRAALGHGLPMRRAKKLVTALLGLRNIGQKADGEEWTEEEEEHAWELFCMLAEAVTGGDGTGNEKKCSCGSGDCDCYSRPIAEMSPYEA